MTYQEIQSKSIDFLRFPLIIGVIFIHNYSSTIIVQGTEIGNDSFMPMYHVVSELFSQVIGRVAVPLFFLFSGFLFFLNIDFNKETYLRKLKGRYKSLFIPYLFWNIAFLLFYYAATHLPILQNYFKGAEYTAEYILSSLWGRVGEYTLDPKAYPIAYQFWFIRDLMVVCILTPVIYLLVKSLKSYGLLLFCVLWYLNIWPEFLQHYGLSSSAWFFFYMGAWLGINRKNLVETFGRFAIPVYIIYPLVALLDVCTKGSPYANYIHNAGILAGILFFFNLTSHYIGKGCWKTSALLSGSSFFVFAIHDPWLLSQFKKIVFIMLRPETDGMLTLVYFIIPLFVTLTALAIYILLRRYMPLFLQVITGRGV